MIKIFNKKTGHSILIDESLPHVNFEPNDWQIDNPHLLIKLPEINLNQHAKSCSDCQAFQKALGTNTNDWYVEYLGKTKRLNLSTFGKDYTKNHLNWTLSEYFSGSILKLNLDTDTIESLKEALEYKESIEDYEGCSLILVKLDSISK